MADVVSLALAPRVRAVFPSLVLTVVRARGNLGAWTAGVAGEQR
ncbi:MAG TPA: hypothetical protein VF163_18615 [Micromonosporaceae bacterium]